MYRISDSSTWKTIGTKYGTASTVKFTPSAAGNYDILISVKDSSGKTSAKRYSLTVTGAALKSTSTISGTDVLCGTKIILTGSAEGGTSEYYYTYQYQKPGKTSWITLGEKYGTSQSANFTPKYAGTYNARILVKDSSGTVKSSVFTVTVTGTLLENKSTISSTSVSANTAVTITAVAKEGTTPYYYTYEYKKSTNSTWTTIGKRNNTNTSASFTPTEKGEYNARVYIKDASGFVTVKNFNVTVK